MTSKFKGALQKLQAVESSGPEIQKNGIPENKEAGNHESPKAVLPENMNSDLLLNLNSGFPETALSGLPENGNEESTSEREKYSTYIDGELITRLKLYAIRNRLKHRQVVEAAILHYLDLKEGQG